MNDDEKVPTQEDIIASLRADRDEHILTNMRLADRCGELEAENRKLRAELERKR